MASLSRQGYHHDSWKHGFIKRFWFSPCFVWFHTQKLWSDKTRWFSEQACVKSEKTGAKSEKAGVKSENTKVKSEYTKLESETSKCKIHTQMSTMYMLCRLHSLQILHLCFSKLAVYYVMSSLDSTTNMSSLDTLPYLECPAWTQVLQIYVCYMASIWWGFPPSSHLVVSSTSTQRLYIDHHQIATCQNQSCNT